MDGNRKLDNGLDKPLLYRYDIKKYDLCNEISSWFKTKDLSSLHNLYDSSFGILTFETDQSTIFHKTFYSLPSESAFYKVYRDFIIKNIQPLFSEEIIYQKIPTFRAQVPNNLGVAQWHRDKDYNHSSEEINIYLPLTDAYGTSTVWTETKEGLGDFIPLDATVGEYYVWSGANWKHGNKVNETGKTRVSIDFRVMPLSKYVDNDRTSTSNSTKMTMGHYWAKFNEV